MRDIIQIFLLCVECFFIVYMIGYATFSFCLWQWIFRPIRRQRRNLLKNELSNEYYVPVSILVPAHNEALTIEATIRSLLALDYKLYEIIVVDDAPRTIRPRWCGRRSGCGGLPPHPTQNPLSAGGGGL